MSETVYTDQLPTVKRHHTTPNGKTHSYTITILTVGCYLFESDRTHMVRQFGSPKALHDFWTELKGYLDRTQAIN